MKFLRYSFYLFIVLVFLVSLSFPRERLEAEVVDSYWTEDHKLRILLEGDGDLELGWAEISSGGDFFEADEDLLENRLVEIESRTPEDQGFLRVKKIRIRE